VITIQIRVSAEDLYLLISQLNYTHIRVYSSATATGTFTEITNVGTRIPLQTGILAYTFTDLASNRWYKYTFGNSTTESTQSDAFQKMLGDPTKVGYFFGNYTPPIGSFGEVLTADDLRYHYMWGIDAVANDLAKSEWDDNQTRLTIESSVKDFEKWLTIDIYHRVYKCNPNMDFGIPVNPPRDIKVPIWMSGDAHIYTDEEAPYDFNPDEWMNYGFLQLRHRPILTINRLQLVGPTGVSVLDLKNSNWTRLNKKSGQLNSFPRNQMIFGPAMLGYGSILMWTMRRYPQGLECDYESGFQTAADIPSDLREVIGKLAAVKMLNFVGDGLLPGFSSQSVSLDGLSEAFSSTQSPENVFFGARIHDYLKDIKEFLQRNRYKYSNIPMGFVGG
jgi:hypothetical protein